MVRINIFVGVVLLFLCGAFSALAQAPADQPNELRCASGTACKTGTIPVFASNGGSATEKTSIMRQFGDAIHVGGGLIANTGGSTSSNTVLGNNTQTDSLGQGAGTFGELSQNGESGVGSAWGNGGAGAWGDGGTNDSSSTLANYAVLGTSDNKSGGIFENNGPNYYSLFGFNQATGSTGFPWAAFNGDGFGCSIDTVGDLSCSGTKNAVVPVDGNKHWVAMSAIESPNVWFEDFGSAELRGGVAVVRLDAKFMQTVNTKSEYHVFLTPNGDCKGLYVHQKSVNSFEVRELGGGSASVKFDYRISALRKGYEKNRFVEHSREFPANRDGSVHQK
jgi:hypothetical protein